MLNWLGKLTYTLQTSVPIPDPTSPRKRNMTRFEADHKEPCNIRVEEDGNQMGSNMFDNRPLLGGVTRSDIGSLEELAMMDGRNKTKC